MSDSKSKKPTTSPSEISRRSALKTLAAGASGITFAHQANADVKGALPAINYLLLDDCGSTTEINYHFVPFSGKTKANVVFTPEGASSADIVVKGAGGASADAGGSSEALRTSAPGGSGGSVTVTGYSVTVDERFIVNVGEGGSPNGSGGENGGGSGGLVESKISDSAASGGGGGGHSLVYAPSGSVLALAGGGGGAGGGARTGGVSQYIGGSGGSSSYNENGYGGNGLGTKLFRGFGGQGGLGSDKTGGYGASEYYGGDGLLGYVNEGGSEGGSYGGAGGNNEATVQGPGGGGGGGGAVGGAGGGAGGSFDEGPLQQGGAGGGGGGSNFFPEGAVVIADGGGAGGIAASGGSSGAQGESGSVSITFRGSCLEVTPPLVEIGEANLQTLVLSVLQSQVISDGGSTVTQRGLVISSLTEEPTLENNEFNVPAGSGIGAFDVIDFDLGECCTDFNIRAYATNELGTVYSSFSRFVTTPDL